MQIKDVLITDFTTPAFTEMFKRYFSELNVNVKNWENLFKEMNNEERNFAYVRFGEDGNCIGFIQFTIMTFSSWFFESNMGFVRELWIENEYRRRGHGRDLLLCAEKYFIQKDIYKSILTTDTASDFYISCGYVKDIDILAKNKDTVFIKNLR